MLGEIFLSEPSKEGDPDWSVKLVVASLHRGRAGCSEVARSRIKVPLSSHPRLAIAHSDPMRAVVPLHQPLKDVAPLEPHFYSNNW